MQDQDLVHQVEELIQIVYMEEEPKPQNQYVDMIRSTQQVIIQSPPPLATELDPSEEGEVFPLDDGPVMDMYNLSYNEFQKNIVQVCRNHFPDELASPTIIRETVIVTDIRKNLNAIFVTNVTFEGATKSNTKYLMTKNKKLAKNLQDARREVEQLHVAAQNVTSTHVHLEEIMAMILGEVLTLGETIWNLYKELVTMLKEVVHFHGLQQKCKYFSKTLRNAKFVTTVMHEWSM